MAWRRPGDKPLSEPMMVSLPTHICVTRPQWVNTLATGRCGSNFTSVFFKLFFTKWSLGHFLRNYSYNCATEHLWWEVNIGSAAWQHQAITYANADPDLCRHMTSLGHNEFNATDCPTACRQGLCNNSQVGIIYMMDKRGSQIKIIISVKDTP